MSDIDIFTHITNVYNELKAKEFNIGEIINVVTARVNARELSVDEKVKVSSHILKMLSKDERRTLAMHLLEEQVLQQREKLTYWSTITAQSSQLIQVILLNILFRYKLRLPDKG